MSSIVYASTFLSEEGSAILAEESRSEFNSPVPGPRAPGGLSSHSSQTCCESVKPSTSDTCFWNPQSRVTNETCTTCRAACLGRKTHLHFVQFSIGIICFALLLQPGVVFYVIVASNLTSKKNQVHTCDFFFTCDITILKLR